MAKEESILFSIQLNTTEAQKKLVENEIELKKLKQANADLSKAVALSTEEEQQNTAAVIANKARIAELTAENKTLDSVLRVQENSIDALRASNTRLIAERNKLDATTEEGTKRIQAINDEIDKNNEIIKSNVSGVEQQKINIGNYSSALDEVAPGLGVFSSKLDESTKAGGGFAQGLKGIALETWGVIKAALTFLATPLGLTIAALASAFLIVKNAISSSEGALDKFEDVTTSISAAFQVLKQNVESVGKIFLSVFSGNLREAGNQIASLAGKIGDAVDETLSLNDAMRSLEDATNAYNLSNAKAQTQIAQLLLQSKNRTLSEQERIDLLNKASQIEEEQQKQAYANAQTNLELLTRQMALEREDQLEQAGIFKEKGESVEQYAEKVIKSGILTKESNDEIIKAYQDLQGVSQAGIQLQEKINNQRDALEQKEADRLAKAAKDRQDAEKKRLEDAQKVAEERSKLLLKELNDQKAALERQLLQVEKNSEAELDIQIKLREKEKQIELQNTELTANQKLLIEAQAFADEAKLTADFLKTQKDLRQKAIDEQISSIEDGEKKNLLILQKSFLQEQELRNQSLQDDLAKAGENRELKNQIRQQYNAQAQVDEQALQDSIFAIKENALQAEITQLEDGTTAKVEKEVELEQLRTDRMNAIKQDEADKAKALAEGNMALDQARLNSASSLVDGIISLTGQQTAAGKAAFAIQKGLALAEVAINLQKELTAISAANSAYPVPVGPAIIASQQLAAIIRAGVAAAKIGAALVKFDSGGVDNIAFEGGRIPARGGMISGRSHSAGGVKFKMRSGAIGEADGRKGEAYIVNTGNDPYLKALASSINVAGGGKAFFDMGGIVKFADGGVSMGAVNLLPLNNTQDIAEIIAGMPAPVVLVDDIYNGLGRKSEIEDRAIL